MPEAQGLLSAFILAGRGGGRAIDWPEVRDWKADVGTLWVHLDRKDQSAQQWLRNKAGLDTTICDALLNEETRPRALIIDDGVILILRGVNLNPGAEPDDMISVRMWVDTNRVISLRHPHLMAVQDVRDDLIASKGPHTSGQVPVSIASHRTERMQPVLSNLDDVIDSLEEQVVDKPSQELRRQLAHIRRQAISLRRHIAPQRDAISCFYNASDSLLTGRDKARLRELQDRTTRYVEDLDSLRERAAVVQEELASRMAELINRNMYVLSLVAGIFLPLGLLTGLLGINVGGMPGSESDGAFWIVCAILLGLGIFGAWLFRRLLRAFF